MAARQKQFKQDIKDLDQSPIEIKDKKLSEGFKASVGNPRGYDNKPTTQIVENAGDWKARLDAELEARRSMRGEEEKVTKYKQDFTDKPPRPEGETLDYKKLKQEKKLLDKKELAKGLVKRVEGLVDSPGKITIGQDMAKKAKEAVRATGLDDHLRKLAKGSKAIGGIAAIPAAIMAGSADQAMADVLIPGGLEGAGEGSDMPMQDDTPQVEMMSNYATDPNMRRMALQELRSRRR